MKIITGNTGTKHVTSEDDGTLYASIVGKDDYILDMNDNFSHEVIDTNTIRINSGDALLNGRQVRIPKGSYDLVSIDNGQTGYKRIDLIVIRYESNKVIESANLFVIKGSQTTGTPTTPEYNKESILDGALIHDVPLYKVHLNGINLEKVEKVFTERNFCISNLGYRPNLLINGDFQVNQRGQTQYASVDWHNRVYSVDRWCILGGGGQQTKVVANESGTITLSTINEAGSLYQFLEKTLKEDYYTLTVNVLSVNGVAHAYIMNEFVTLKKGINTLTYYGEVEQVILLVGSQSSVEVEYVKLEQGSVATPFVPRLYAEELMLCQRYGYLYNPVDYFDMAFMFFTESLKQHNISIPFPMKMRSIPTLKVISGNVARKDRKTNLTYLNTDMATDIANESGYKIKVSYEYDFPLNQPVEFFSFNNLKLFFDAEIY